MLDQRAELDELLAPEKALCLGKAFNLELATRGFPAREAYEVKKSFADTVTLDFETGKLGIERGGVYHLDLFHAERHSHASNFRIDSARPVSVACRYVEVCEMFAWPSISCT